MIYICRDFEAAWGGGHLIRAGTPAEAARLYYEKTTNSDSMFPITVLVADSDENKTIIEVEPYRAFRIKRV